MKECCRICKQVGFRPKICPQCGFPDINASKYLCLNAIRLDLCSPTSTVLSLTLSLQNQPLNKVGFTHQVTLLTTCYTVKFSPGQTGNLATRKPHRDGDFEFTRSSLHSKASSIFFCSQVSPGFVQHSGPALVFQIKKLISLIAYQTWGC